MGYKLRPASDFEKYVARGEPSACWPWTGKSKHAYGYGLFELKNLDTGRFSGVVAHRVAWMLYKGDIPPGLQVRHKCDNPPCCNPDHLELGTHQDNMQDRRDRGTHGYSRTTHCKNGHPWTPENTCVLATGWKRCRTCRRISMGYKA